MPMKETLEVEIRGKLTGIPQLDDASERKPNTVSGVGLASN